MLRGWFLVMTASLVIIVTTASTAGAEVEITERVSVDAGGGDADRFSANPSISADGRFIAFESYANDLIEGDGNHQRDIYVRDMMLGTTMRASVDTDGGDPDAESTEPSISADGRYVAFESTARDLVVEDGNREADIFVRDLIAGTTARASIGIDGRDPNDESFHAAISAEGRHVAFASRASNLVAGDGNGGYEVFVRDLVAGITIRASVDRDGGDPNSLSSSPSISADGRYVAFDSDASDLVQGDGTIGFPDIFVRDLVVGITIRVSVDRRGGTRTPPVRIPPSAPTADTWRSSPTPTTWSAMTTRPMRTSSSETSWRGPRSGPAWTSEAWTPTGDSEKCSISADGRFVSFESEANDLVSGDDNHQDIFVRDLLTGTTTWVSIDRTGERPNDDSHAASVSPDARYIAFQSHASDLVRNDHNDHQDVFVRRMSRWPTG